VPLLFEAGQAELYDATIAVTADEDVRRARASARGHQAVDGRESRQFSQTDKAARATYVVVNDGDVHELEHKLSSVLGMLGV
jgi:dephospho-CoA kinase